MCLEILKYSSLLKTLENIISRSEDMDPLYPWSNGNSKTHTKKSEYNSSGKILPVLNYVKMG